MFESDNDVVKMSRRRLVKGSIAAGAGMMSASRTWSVTASTRPVTRTQAPATFNSDKISFALSADDLAKIQPLLDEYAQTNNVIVETQTFPYQSLYERLNISLTQATGDFDVVSMDDPWMPLFAGNQFLMNLDDLMDSAGITLDEDFVPELVELGSYPPGSGLRGIPWIGSVQVFAWRTDVMSDLGLDAPLTWDDVLDSARIISEEEIDGLYGVGLRGIAGNPATTSFLPTLRGHGVDIFDEAWQPQLETDEAMAAIRLHMELKDLAPPGVQNVGHEENGRNMYTGRIAQSGDIWPDQLLQTFDPELSEVVGQVGVGAEPAQEGVDPANMTGNWLLGVPEGARNPEGALDFILWFTAPEQQKRLLMDQNIAATRMSVLEDPEAVERLPFLPGLLSAARNAVPRPRTEHYPAVEEILGHWLAQAIADQVDGEEAMRQANQEIRDLMIREGVLDE